MNNIIIRPEKVSDYNKIAEINALAFNENKYVGEMTLVDSLRHCVNFDPELTLVAEIDGSVIGHILFFPCNLVIENKEVSAVLLGPVAVMPEFQNKGIGGKLIEEGHKISKEKGFKFSFLWGHPTYYPRFGFDQHMFGSCEVKLKRDNIKDVNVEIKERNILSKDIEILNMMWDKWYGNIDLSLKPTKSIVDYITHNPSVKAKAITLDDEVIGYIRYTDFSNINMFLAKDKTSAITMVKYINSKLNKDDELKLPLHPDSCAKEVFANYESEFKMEPWGACMIKILDEECAEIVNYCKEIKDSTRILGHIILPPYYEVA